MLKMVISIVRMISGPTMRDNHIIVIQAFIAESCSISQVHLMAKECRISILVYSLQFMLLLEVFSGSFRICSKMVISIVRMKSGPTVRDDYIIVI